MTSRTSSTYHVTKTRHEIYLVSQFKYKSPLYRVISFTSEKCSTLAGPFPIPWS